MNLFLEDPVPGLVLGAVLVTLAAIVYSSLRTSWSLIALALAVALGGVAFAIEQVVVTPREQAEQALQGLLDAVEADDLQGVLTRLAPQASSVRADAQTLMPMFDIEKANLVGAMEVSLDDPSSPSRADVKCRVFVSARHRRQGAKGGDMADVTFHFVRAGEGWLLEDYVGASKWRKGAKSLGAKR